ncbi:hypothetical protein ACFLZY_02160 [Patescibacteria group bacterium]
MPERKKVTICASIKFTDEIAEWKKKLEQDGYEVIQYPKKLSGEFLPSYEKEFSEHYQKICNSDIVLALNYTKKGVDGYIGAAVFAEIAFAIGLNRTYRQANNIEVFHVNPIADSLPHREELQFWQDLEWLKIWK